MAGALPSPARAALLRSRRPPSLPSEPQPAPHVSIFFLSRRRSSSATVEEPRWRIPPAAQGASSRVPRPGSIRRPGSRSGRSSGLVFSAGLLVVHCLRLLRRFNSKEFKQKSTTLNYKLGKKALATHQVMELPLENCIYEYDMINAQGANGVTLVEVPLCTFQQGNFSVQYYFLMARARFSLASKGFMFLVFRVIQIIFCYTYSSPNFLVAVCSQIENVSPA